MLRDQLSRVHNRNNPSTTHTPQMHINRKIPCNFCVVEIKISVLKLIQSISP